jgi:hypothetical protein
LPYECVLLSEEGTGGCVSPRVLLSWNLRRMHGYWNFPLCKQLSFCFLASFSFGRKRNIPIGNGTGEHIKLRELPSHNNALGFFFCGGRSLKIHIEIKRELFCGIRETF